MDFIWVTSLEPQIHEETSLVIIELCTTIGETVNFTMDENNCNGKMQDELEWSYFGMHLILLQCIPVIDTTHLLEKIWN